METKPAPRYLHARPSLAPPLDPGFLPIALGNARYMQAVGAFRRSKALVLSIERSHGSSSRFETRILPKGDSDADTLLFVERLVKFLLYQIGGWQITVGGPPEIAEHIGRVYAPGGARAFDVELMQKVYEKSFVVKHSDPEMVTKANETAANLGGHLDGCRIGFDLGASDYKLAAVQDGKVVFSTEIPWDPKIEKDPDFHYRKINEGLKLAASHLPRVDAIGGSSAGIYIDNKVMIASLFRAVPESVFKEKVKPLFLKLQKEWGIPFEVANDGDVTALAGAMSLGAKSILGIAMGSSQAAGFLNGQGKITGWLNELAFAPIDYQATAVDEWSGDGGCGAQYFSQQAVVRLAPLAGIELPPGHQAEQLKFVQELHIKGDPRAAKIFETIGIYLGYALAHYSAMYDYKHVLVLGRVTSGDGGEIIVQKAKQVLEIDFPKLAGHIEIHLPDEKSKRVGQAVAAASLPKLK